MGHLIREHWRVHDMTVSCREEGDGVVSLEWLDKGSIFQAVSDHRSRVARAEILGILRPLDYREPEWRVSWYIRRGKRYLPWLLAWHLCTWLETTEGRVARWLVRSDYYEDGIAWPSGEAFSWRAYWRRCLLQEHDDRAEAGTDA